MVKRTVVEQDGNVRIVTEEDEHYIKITQEELVGVITKKRSKDSWISSMARIKSHGVV